MPLDQWVKFALTFIEVIFTVVEAQRANIKRQQQMLLQLIIELLSSLVHRLIMWNHMKIWHSNHSLKIAPYILYLIYNMSIFHFGSPYFVVCFALYTFGCILIVIGLSLLHFESCNLNFNSFIILQIMNNFNSTNIVVLLALHRVKCQDVCA